MGMQNLLKIGKLLFLMIFFVIFAIFYSRRF